MLAIPAVCFQNGAHRGPNPASLFDDQLWANRQKLIKGFLELNAWTAASWSPSYNSATGACINSSLDVTDVNQAQKGLENTLSPLIQ